MALILVLALVFPLGVRFLTGSWIHELSVLSELESGLTFANASFPFRGQVMVVWYGVIADTQDDTLVFTEPTTTINSGEIKFGYKHSGSWGTINTASINISCPRDSQNPWRDRRGFLDGVAIPLAGDIQEVSKIIYDVKDYIDEFELSTNFFSDFQTWLEDGFQITFDQFREGTQFDSVISIVGIANVPIRVSMDWDVEELEEHPIYEEYYYGFNFEGYVKLTNDVFSVVEGLPSIGTENAQVSVLGLLGQYNPFENVVPTGIGTDLIDALFGDILFVREIKPSPTDIDYNIDTLPIVGLPTDIDFMIGRKVDTANLYEVSVEGNPVSTDTLKFKVSVGLPRIREEIEFDVVLPIVFSGKIFLGTVEIPGYENFNPEVFELLDYNELFENWDINREWTQTLENWNLTIENLPFEDAAFPPLPDIGETLFTTPEITYPEFSASDIVTYSAPAWDIESFTETVNPEIPEPTLEPFLLDIAIVLIIIFAILGALIWLKV